jgi:U3 small nucleolar RNA-associated protein 22
MNSYAMKRRKLNTVEEKSRSILAKESHDGEKLRDEIESLSTTKMAAVEDKSPLSLNNVNSRPDKRQKHESFSLIAGDVCKSSKFLMQLDEMLAEVRPDYEKRLVPMESVLRKLKAIVEKLPDVEPLSVCAHLSQLLYDGFKMSLTFVDQRCPKKATQVKQSHDSIPESSSF